MLTLSLIYTDLIYELLMTYLIIYLTNLFIVTKRTLYLKNTLTETLKSH